MLKNRYNNKNDNNEGLRSMFETLSRLNIVARSNGYHSVCKMNQGLRNALKRPLANF